MPKCDFNKVASNFALWHGCSPVNLLHIIRSPFLNPLSAKFIKWSNTLKQIVCKLPTICLSVFDHFSGLALKGLRTPLDGCFCIHNDEKYFSGTYSIFLFMFSGYFFSAYALVQSVHGHKKRKDLVCGKVISQCLCFLLNVFSDVRKKYL